MPLSRLLGVGLIAGVLVAGNWDKISAHIPDIDLSAFVEQKESEQVVTEAEVWEALQDWCKEGKVADTDELIRICRGLKDLELLTDISRVEEYAEKNAPVTSSVVESLTQ